MDMTMEQVTECIVSKNTAGSAHSLDNRRATPLNEVSNHRHDATASFAKLATRQTIARQTVAQNGDADDVRPYHTQCPWWMCIDLQ